MVGARQERKCVVPWIRENLHCEATVCDSVGHTEDLFEEKLSESTRSKLKQNACLPWFQGPRNTVRDTESSDQRIEARRRHSHVDENRVSAVLGVWVWCVIL